MAVFRSLVSYCSVSMISQMMWAVKDVRHRCDGSATYARLVASANIESTFAEG